MRAIPITQHIQTIKVQALGPKGLKGDQGEQGIQGPQGEQGEEGPSGTGDATLTQSFSNVNSVTLSHVLNKFPNVVVKDSGGTEQEVEVIYNSISSVTAQWNFLMTGTITLN